METHMTFQLVLPDDHRCNLTEKAIQTWKYHLISVIIRTAEIFLFRLWFQAIPQLERQLLILRKSNVNPKVSAYTQVHGPPN